jgi:hypothetical protein
MIQYHLKSFSYGGFQERVMETLLLPQNSWNVAKIITNILEAQPEDWQSEP